MYKTLVFLICLPFFLQAKTLPADSGYFTVVAQKGDGIYALMRKYELESYNCNFDLFYSLNNLKKNAPLFVGKSYQLPIKTYKYNGKSIRSTIGNEDWDTAVRIQKYNERMFERTLKTGDYRKDMELWVPHHEIACPRADLNIPAPAPPPAEVVIGEAEFEIGKTSNTASGERKFPIFGSKYAYTPLESNSLKGKVFYIVSGHGGPDPGAIGTSARNRLCEDEYAYDVALRLCRNLIAHGATAYMITRDYNDGIRDEQYLKCDSDEVLWGDVEMVTSHRARLFQRSHIINTLYEQNRKKGVTDQKMIVIHVDSRSKRQRIDLFFYYKEEGNSGKALANKLQKTLKQKYAKYRPYHGTTSVRDLHMLRETTPTGVYIELGNIKNAADQQRILLESNRQALANWLFDGLK